MRPGTRIAGRWIVEAELPGTDELRRFRVRDTAGSDGGNGSGAVAEAVAPTGHVLLRAGVRDAFTGEPPGVLHPAYLPILATDVVEGLPVRVRAAVRSPFDGVRLDAAQVVAAAGWLAPAVIAGGGAAFGELGPEDIVVDPDGVVRFAPTGVPRAESVARVPHTRAPEGACTAEADLYGLGVTLYRALTGGWPSSARTAAELRPGGPAASAHGVDPAADALLAGLLSADPAERRAALDGLPCAPVIVPVVEPAPPAELSVAPSNAVAGGPIRTTVAAPADRPATPDMLPWTVLVPLTRLSPATLRAVATRSAVDATALQRAASQGGTWAVDTVQTEAEARRLMARLESAGVTGVTLATTSAPKVIQFVVLAAVSAVIAALTSLTFVFGAVTVLLLYLAAVNLRAMFAVATTRMALAERARVALPDTAPEARLRALRQRIAAANLPGIVLDDLRAEVARIEVRLDDVRGHEAELASVADEALGDRRAKVAAELSATEAAVEALGLALTRATTAELEDTEPARRLAEPADTQAAPAEHVEVPPVRPKEPTSG